MCLQLKYAEALFWKRRASKVIADAKAKALSIPCDPLFEANPRLSSLVSEIDGIKKRHGLLIEDALLFAINKLPHWSAAKDKVQVAGGKAHLDCLAFNSSTGKLYVFECKRGHGSFDYDKTAAIDQRLDKVGAAIGPHATAKGWAPGSMDTFILSFYGTKWKSKYQIYTRDDVGSLFEPCIGRFVVEYMQFVEGVAASTYSEELRESVAVSTSGSIFDLIVEERGATGPDVLFTDHGADFVKDGNEPQPGTSGGA